LLGAIVALAAPSPSTLAQTDEVNPSVNTGVNPSEEATPEAIEADNGSARSESNAESSLETSSPDFSDEPIEANLGSPIERLDQESLELFNQGDFTGALNRLETLLQEQRSRGDYAAMGETLNGIGLIQESLGDPDKALEAYQQALEVYGQLATTGPELALAGEARILNTIGAVYANLGEPEAALGFVERALVIFRELQAPGEEVVTLTNLAGLYMALGQFSDAIETFQQSLTIAQSLNNTRALYTVWERLSAAYAQVGAFPAALDTLNRAVDRAIAVEDPLSAAIFLTRVGEVEEVIRNFEGALAAYNRSLALLEGLEQPIARQQLYARLGAIHTELAQFPEALDHYQQALAMAEASDEILQQGELLALIGTLQHQQGELDAAQQTYEQAIALVQPLNFPLAEGRLLRGLGAVYHDGDNLSEALAVTQQALGLQQGLLPQDVAPLVQQQEEGLTLNLLGDVYRAQQQYDEALGTYQQALERHDQANDPVGKGETLRDVGLTLVFQDRAVEAAEPLLQALEIWEYLSYNTGIILEPISEAYQILQSALIAAERTEVALLSAEQERSLPIRLQQGWQQGLQALPPAGLTLAEIRGVVAQQGTPLLFYDIGAELTPEEAGTIPKLRIWLVLPGGEISLEEVDLRAAGFTDLQLFLELVEASEDPSSEALQQLAELVVVPIAPALEQLQASPDQITPGHPPLDQTTNLLVVPPPGLPTLPFERLPLITETTTGTLGDSFTVQLAYSIQAIVLALEATESPLEVETQSLLQSD
jgi:tetratricopeptide (TPR) repeat protein